jgi:spermidine synthase
MINQQDFANTRTTPTSLGRLERICWLMLFFSGALALVYEILWMRYFTTLFGATAPATAATLAAVFLGFTAGSILLGRIAVRFPRPIVAYGVIEIAVGVSALLVGPLLSLYHRLYPAFYQRLGGSGPLSTTFETVLVMAALFPPTFLMGGTLPILCLAISSSGRSSRRSLGLSGGGLYAANTIGATLGALSLPFFWLRFLGLHGSYAICVIGNLLVGALACWLGRNAFQTPVDPSPPQRSRSDTRTIPRSLLSRSAIGMASALSGMAMFILQITWGRMFAQVHENSIYSFSVVLAVFLIALGAAAALVRILLKRQRSARTLLAFAWIAGGLAVFASPHLFYWMSGGLAYLKGNGGWSSHAWQLLWLAATSIFLPAFLTGMALPALMELAGQTTHTAAARNAPVPSPSPRAEGGDPSSKTLGWLIGMNTASAILGALLAAFWLPKWLGLWNTIAAVGLVLVLAGDLSLGRWTRLPRRILLLAVAGGLFFLWNPNRLPRARIDQRTGERLLSVQEGTHGIVAVVDKAGSRRIKLENYYILGGTASTGDERMQAHIPLLIHPAPRRVAFVGLGTGIPAGAALLHPVERITAVELVPEVVVAARDYFQQANLDIVNSPRAEIRIDDARSFLRGSGRKFDVIIGDLVVPWRRGEAALYSSDHFKTTRNALAPGGLFCQWLPLFQLSREEFSIIAATFLDTFPRTTVWRGDFAPDQPAIALIGEMDDFTLDPSVIERRIAELKPDDQNRHLTHPAGLWIFQAGFLLPGDDDLARSKRNDENHPWVELLAPLSHAGSATGKHALFVGPPLERWIDRIRKRDLSVSPLRHLGPSEIQWQDAGAGIREASQFLLEQKPAQANVRMQQAITSLPPEVQQALGGL